VFRDVCRFWKLHIKCPKLKRSSSDFHSDKIISPDSTRFICTSKLTTLNGSVTPNGSNAVSPVMTLGKHFHRTALQISNLIKILTLYSLFSYTPLSTSFNCIFGDQTCQDQVSTQFVLNLDFSSFAQVTLCRSKL
jgi:hypothetical protein